MAKSRVKDEQDPSKERLRLVRLAFTGGYVQWIDDKTALRVQGDPANQGLTATTIKKLARDWIAAGNEIVERCEERQGWEDRREFWYYVIIPVSGFARGLFVEMELTDDDEECPEVSLVNAHPQRQGKILWPPPE